MRSAATILLALYALMCHSAFAGDVLALAKKLAEKKTQVIDNKTQAKTETNPEKKAELQKKAEAGVADIVQTGRENKDDARAQLLVTKTLSDVGEPKRAAPFADNAVALAQTRGDRRLLAAALTIRADVNYELRDYPKVVEDAKAVLKFDPENDRARLLLQLSEGRGGSAAENTAPGRAQQQQQQPTPEEIVLSRPTSKAERQLATLSAAMALGAGDQLRAREFIGQAQNKMALDPEAARRLLDKALAADPKSAAARLQRAKADLALGDHAAALKDADQALGLDPKNASAYWARGEAKKALGYPAEEVNLDYKTSADLDPNFLPAYRAALARQYQPAAETGKAAPGAGAPNNSSGIDSRFSTADRLFGGLPRRTRKTIALGGGVGLGLLVALWLKRKMRESR